MPEGTERRLSGPVGWLLDRQLMTNLREILLYSAFGTRIDPRNWMMGREVDLTDGFKGSELWFDYLSDTGDGMRATYSMAYLAYSDVWASSPDAPGDAALEPDAERAVKLPRGAFLVVGGDTAYHVADYETLVDRFQFPFNRAFGHLAALGKVNDNQDARRPIFGIPGNHDYYDFLDGFNRQFRRPFNPEDRYNRDAKTDQPQLVIEGFRRLQWASYFSLKLPFAWRMWGMDAQGGAMDRRQKDFFRRIRCDPDKPTERLIVATPEPITAFGRRGGAETEIARTLTDIGLPLPYLLDDPAEALPPGSCRLDIAGDVHQYARYWGSEPGAEKPARYASVVSGLGGAFLHSTSTDVGEVPSAKCYPEPGPALAETLRRLLRPWSIFLGGRVWQIGLLVAGLMYIGASVAPSLRSALAPVLGLAGLELPIRVDSGDLVIRALSALYTSLKIDESALKAGRGLFHPELVYLPVLLGLVLFGTWRNGKLATKARHGEPVPDSAYSGPVRLLAAAAVGSGLWIYGWPGYPYGIFHPLAADFVVLTMLVVSFLGLWWCRQYDDAMNGKVRRTGSLSLADQAQGWVLWVFTLLAGLFGVTRYGFFSLGVAAIDIAFLIVVLGVLIGLPVYAWKVGAEIHRLRGKAGFLLLGLFHAALQLATPLVLVTSQPPLIGWMAAASTILVTWGVGRLVPLLLSRAHARGRHGLGVVLLGLWVALVAALLALALARPVRQEVNLASFTLALGLGLVFSCVWFGWYLAVSLCFDGHNNEAGGGARIEQFKQLIRFRITEERLTGYVIAVDEPSAEGWTLKPRVVDVFEVRPGQG